MILSSSLLFQRRGMGGLSNHVLTAFIYPLKKTQKKREKLRFFRYDSLTLHQIVKNAHISWASQTTTIRKNNIINSIKQTRNESCKNNKNDQLSLDYLLNVVLRDNG